MTHLQRNKWIGWLIISLLSLSMSPNLHAQHKTDVGTQTKPLAKIAGFLEQSGYTYTKVSQNVWTVGFKGKALSEFNVTISGNESTLVVFVVLVEQQKSLHGNIQELMYKLLKFTNASDYVKLCIGDDSELLVRSDLPTRTLDLQEFKDGVEQVAAATDEIYATVRPYVTAR